jgi:DMSO reductase family type II enzyme chaperone
MRKSSEIEIAAARGFIYRWLALAYTSPDRVVWEWLRDTETRKTVRHALHCLVPSLRDSWTKLEIALTHEKLPALEAAHRAAFGHTVRGDCPPNEIEYGELKADPLFQPHRLADIAAFYRAFGMELAPDAPDRPDYIVVEFEFMTVLAAKEAHALENKLDAEKLSVCRDALRDFLAEHLARWTPAFTRRIETLSADNFLRALAIFTREFILSDCARYGVQAGNHDLQLRPTDIANETLCGECGINATLPGAMAEKL